MGKVVVSGAYETEEFLERLRALVMALTPLPDMAVLMDMDEMVLSDLLEDRTTAASRMFRKTRAEMKLQLRKLNIELANAGSPTGIEAVRQYVADSEI